MNLRTQYLGLDLAHPFMPGASPMVDDLDVVKRLEDAGASAIVMHSLFEEQLTAEQLATHHYVDFLDGRSAEAQTYLPDPAEFRLGPDAYLDQVRLIKKSVRVPVIASLNGTTLSGWLEHAKLIEQAGADALELNVFSVAADPHSSGADLEKRIVEMTRELKKLVKIPVAVKLSPFYSSLAHFARELERAGASGLVLFNRVFQPDIDPDALEVRRVLHLSDPSELPLRLRWLGILSPQLTLSLAASGGVHHAPDAVQALMAGAHAVQMVSSLLMRGPEHLRKVRTDVENFMSDHEYASLADLRGSMNLARCPDPVAYTRANYIHLLQSWRPDRR
jgi:dihydroorotate dehydrogenase (fumarate)